MNPILICEAIHFAAEKHTIQRRKNDDKIPYINHPIHVAAILSSAGVTCTATICAAYLHDTIEDTNASYSEIKNLFGEKIADTVKECTDDKRDEKVKRKMDQIEHAKSISPEAKLVKLADKISNLSTLASNPPLDWTNDEITGYVIWSYAVCRNLRGLNENLDEMINTIFDDFGIKRGEVFDDSLNESLKEYYTLLETKYYG
jgi:(p)ppGpp synthase/HD superfamily hydrolase